MQRHVVLFMVLASICGCASRDRTTTPGLTQSEPEFLPLNEGHRDADKTTIQLTSWQGEEPQKDERPYLEIGGDQKPDPPADSGERGDDEPADEDAKSDGDDPEEEGDSKPDSNTPPSDRDDDLPTLDPNGITLDEVIDSVHSSFPLVEAAYREAEIANGNVIAAQGAFDTKLKAASENGPTGFYQTYRQKAGVTQPLMNGGEVFAGYRVGRGDFEPWYQERQTNDGGEFKIGGSMPLIRNRAIDARRAELWRANYDVQIAQPEIRGQLIGFALEAAMAYWKWVAEGRKYFAERDWLKLADERNEQVEGQVKAGALDPPDLIDNNRAIAKRKSKVADQLRKVRQAAVKLSLFLRDGSGTPIVPTLEQLPAFPKPEQIDEYQLDADIGLALTQRPDLQAIRLIQERLQIDYQEACNLGLPRLDAYIAAGQDVGAPTSSKRDKSEFELDAGLLFDMPLQRRKAIGKTQAIEAKIAQVNAKERFTIDKITAGVRATSAGMVQAYQQVLEARKARSLADRMAQIERQKFELGESDLLKVALREQYAIEAIEGEVAALFNYFAARSQYFAELGMDSLSRQIPANQ